MNNDPLRDKFFNGNVLPSICSVFGCREILTLEEQLCGSKCNSCSGNEFGTIKGQFPDYKVKTQLKPQTPVKEELNTSDSKIKGKRYGAIGFGQRGTKSAMFPKPKNYW